jgi:HK97 family phage major capsid protein/HK97 family phage prohead protease
MTTNRAYSVIEFKSMDDEKRTLTGLATTPEADRAGDVVEPKGAKFKLPIPLLWQHDSRQPIGHVTHAKVTAKGIEVVAQLAKVDEDGTLKQRLDEAWQSIKAGLVRGLSIGFRSLEHSYMEGGGIKFAAWEWMELSAVTVPANASCSITQIKSADEAARAASGAKGRGVVRLDPGKSPQPPGVSGTPKQPATGGFFHSRKETEMNIAEQLAAFDTKRKAAIDGASALMTKAAEEGRTLDDHESEQYDGFQTEVKAVDAHIARLKTHEQTMLKSVTHITPDAGKPGTAAIDIGAGVYSVKRNLPPGTAYTRYASALALSKGNIMQAEMMSRRWKDTPEVGMVLKAAVDEGTTAHTTWAAPLVQYNDMQSEFIELLRPRTILGRLDQLRRVPFNIRIPRQTTGTTGTFVGEGSPTPVKSLAFDNLTLPWAKASTIVVITAELAKLSNPSAEALVRNDLLAGISQYLDKRLVDPAYAGVATVSPASLTNGVTPVQASGTTLAALDANVRTVMTTFADNEMGLSSGVWVMSASLAIRLSMMRTNQDSKAFPELTVNGGTFYGLPVIVSNNVVGSGSPGDQFLILIDQSEVLLADDGQMELDVSSEASLEMNDAPSGGATSLRSLWQNNLTGIMVSRWIYWTKRRSAAVQFIDKAQSYSS